MIPLPSPITFYATGGALLLGLAAGYKVRDWQCDAALSNALEQAAEQRQEAQDVVDRQGASYEEARTEAYATGATVEREVRTIYREVPAPPADCEPPAVAVGLLQGRVDHANASASGEPGE